MLKQLQDIFNDVKGRFTPVSDRQQYGVRDYWKCPPETGPIQGDCEDFALACRAFCRKQNIPSRLLTAWTETGVYHCCLWADGYVLDVRCEGVAEYAELPYKWDKMSAFEAGGDWREIKTERKRE